MKNRMIKKLAVVLLACGVLLAAKTDASAESVNLPDKNISYDDEDMISVGYAYKYSGGAGGYTYVNIGDGDSIKNVKSSSDNLLTKVTHYDYYISTDFNYDEATGEVKKERKTRLSSFYIAYFAKKAGKYTVTFDVVDKNGTLKHQGTIKVETYPESSVKNPIKSIKYNGKDIWEYGPYMPKASGKLKVTMNKGYKMTKMELGTYKADSSYEMNYKKIKNNAKIKLATKRYYSSKTSYATTERDDMFPYTGLRIYYKKGKDKTEYTTYYGMNTLNPKSAIKN